MDEREITERVGARGTPTRYLDQVHEVGPLARMYVAGYYRRGVSVLDRLVARALENDHHAFALLFRRHTADVHSFAQRLLGQGGPQGLQASNPSRARRKAASAMTAASDTMPKTAPPERRSRLPGIWR